MKEDARSKKIALVSHCILNQNAVVGGLASFPSVIPRVVDILKAHDFGIVQMPCPEMYAAGLNRWGHVKEQYENSGYKRSFREAADFLLNSIEDYVTHDYQIVIVGIEGSPSCGITISESNPNWGGSFEESQGRDFEQIHAGGAFVDILFEKILLRGWNLFPSIGIFSDKKGRAASVKNLDKFLSEFDRVN